MVSAAMIAMPAGMAMADVPATFASAGKASAAVVSAMVI
jgi:hypothetical protein